MRHRDYNDYWLVTGKDVGLRIFPRAGSTSIGETYGVGHSFAEFCNRKNKACVVRNPWERLMSVWHGMIQSGNFQTYMLKDESVHTLEDWLFWLADQDPFNVDAHITPQWAFIEGWWHPKDDELITMDQFFKAPPFGLPMVLCHKNETDYNEISRPQSVRRDAFNTWWSLVGEKDFELWERAEKSPLTTGGKREANNGQRNSDAA